MPTINRKLLLRLFIVTLALGVGLFLVHYVQSDRATDALRWQADHAAENGKLDKAILYMREYLELRPEDHEAAVQLGDLILKRGSGPRELSSALFLFERVLREAPQREDVRRKLVDICMRLNRHSDAMIHEKALLDKSPREGQLWENLGVSQSAQNKFDDARLSFEKAIECEPNRVRSYELLAELLIRQLNLADDGRELLNTLVRANPANGEAYLVRARYFRSEKKIPECRRDLDKLLEIDPENADGLLILGELLQEKGDIPRSRLAIADGLSLYPKDVRFYRVLSWLELSAGNIAAATACLEKGIQQLPNSVELLTPLGDLLVQQGEIEQVEAIVKKLEKIRDVGTQVRYLRSRVLIRRNKWAEAAAMLESLRTEAVSMPGLAAQVNVLLAACHEHLGNRDARMEDLKRVLAIDAGNLSARLQFGMMHLAAGNLDDAIKEYTIAARSPYATLGSRITLGRLSIARARSGKNAAEWSNISEFVDSLRDKYKNAVDPLLLAAESHMARQQPEIARKLLRSEAGKKVNDVRIWSVLAAIAQESEGLHAALDVLDEAQAIIGDQIELRLARARAWATDWRKGKEERIRLLGKGIDEFSDAEQMRLLSGLADVCSTRGDLEGVKFFQKRIAARMPGELTVRRALFDTAAATGDTVLLAQLRDEIRQLEGAGGTIVSVADALTTIDEPDAKIAEAAALVRKVLAIAPDRADAQLLAARVAEKAGDLKTALKHYENAVDFERTNLKNMEAHLSFLIRSGNDSIAKRRIEQYYHDPRLPGEAFLALVERVTKHVSSEQAEKTMNWVVPLIQDSGVSLLWASRLKSDRRKSASAISLVDRAIAASARLVDAWIARLRLKPESADETLKSARATLDDPAFYLLCAEVAEQMRAANPDWAPPFNKPEHQRTYAQACLKTFIARGDYAKAAESLRKLFDVAKARPEDITWANRNLAILSASRGSAAERRMAIAALKNWVPDTDAGIDDLRSGVGSLTIAVRLLHGAERREAIQQSIAAMKLVVADKEATAKDWYRLAQFQRMTGDRSAYQENLKEAMRGDEGNLFYVVAFVDELLAEGKPREAEPFVSRLRQATHDFRATATAARFYALSSLPGPALEVVDQFIQSADAGTQDGVVRWRQSADLLDRLARLSAAKGLPCAKELLSAALEKYRLTVRNYPEAAGPMASLMAFDNRVQPAFDLLTSMADSLSKKSLSMAALGVLRTGNGSPKHYQLVKGWIESAIQADPGSAPLKMGLAEFYTLQQSYDVAEPIYREVLKLEPDNIVALNNLAWILSTNAASADEALKCVDRAIELVGPTGELLDTRARIFIARGNVDRAIEDLNQALNQSQTSLRYFHLAIAQLKQLKMEDAEKSFKEAKAHGLDPKSIHPSDMPMFKELAARMGE